MQYGLVRGKPHLLELRQELRRVGHRAHLLHAHQAAAGLVARVQGLVELGVIANQLGIVRDHDGIDPPANRRAVEQLDAQRHVRVRAETGEAHLARLLHPFRGFRPRLHLRHLLWVPADEILVLHGQIVDEEHVDVVGLQRRQPGIHHLHPFAGCPGVVFGHDKELLAAAAVRHPRADRFLRLAPHVAVGGVDVADAGVIGRVEHARARRPLCRSQVEDRDLLTSAAEHATGERFLLLGRHLVARRR